MSQTMRRADVEVAGSNGRIAAFEPVLRRVAHGGTRWSTASILKQPQDGAFNEAELQGRVTDIGTRLEMITFGPALLVEPEDARLTGGTRSLVRRLLGLNITPRVKPATPAKPVRQVTAAKRTQVA
jgi:hypothetical protein